ncbi:MAG: TlpA disulfide reductase family protein [Ectothiorhodospiraceae bacterium]|jgi:thiol-disulfide isomerase/thioredoxin|nr:TlpA disulfide reductase family protein [Ectothiorhodospiraceae bacterium]
MHRYLSPLLLFICALLVPPVTGTERLIRVDDANEIPVEVYAAQGDRLLLWLPSEHGLRDGHRRIAAALAENGIEIWLADPLTGFYLPNTPGSLDALPAPALATLLDAAASAGKTVYLLSHDRAVVPTLKGLREWQLHQPNRDSIGGVVLISPNPLLSAPTPGTNADLHPIARSTNIPIYLIQPALSPGYPHLGDITHALRNGGSHVFAQTLPQVRDRFFFRINAFEREHALAQQLPDIIRNGLRLLATQDARRAAAPMVGSEAPTRTTRRDPRLMPVQDNPRHPPLTLDDTGGRAHRLEDYRGQVVLVNFWASWCPPCVHEMPSMQGLMDRYADRGFAILAVNIGEDADAVDPFMRNLKLRFPALLDTQTKALAEWRVFVYPTSFLVDRGGRLRYALHGAIDWEQPDALTTIESLLVEPSGQSTTSN